MPFCVWWSSGEKQESANHDAEERERLVVLDVNRRVALVHALQDDCALHERKPLRVAAKRHDHVDSCFTSQRGEPCVEEIARTHALARQAATGGSQLQGAALRREHLT